MVILICQKVLNPLYICQMELRNLQRECGLEMMEQVHGMDILFNKERGGGKLNFYIQANNPRTQSVKNIGDESLADAIESTFLLNTENAIMMWNYISIPLSYKYDISYMMEDLLKLLHCLQCEESGKMIIHWLPDTFRCDWLIIWNHGQMKIQSHWECTVGNLEIILNNNSQTVTSVKHFISEWKEVLNIVIKGLERCGYDESGIKSMRQLMEQFNNINDRGILYKE